MSDLISRDEAIMAVKVGALSAATVYGRTDEGSTALYETVRAIKAIPSAQPECKQECMPMYANVCDTISRQAAIDAMDTWDWQDLYLPIHFKQLLEELPSTQPKRMKGRWVNLQCTQCGQVDTTKPNFCPNCGADMRGEDDE